MKSVLSRIVRLSPDTPFTTIFKAMFNPENINDPVTYLNYIIKLKGKKYIKSPKILEELIEKSTYKQPYNILTLKQFIKTLKTHKKYQSEYP